MISIHCRLSSSRQRKILQKRRRHQRHLKSFRQRRHRRHLKSFRLRRHRRHLKSFRLRRHRRHLKSFRLRRHLRNRKPFRHLQQKVRRWKMLWQRRNKPRRHKMSHQVALHPDNGRNQKTLTLQRSDPVGQAPTTTPTKNYQRHTNADVREHVV